MIGNVKIDSDDIVAAAMCMAIGFGLAGLFLSLALWHSANEHAYATCLAHNPIEACKALRP